MGIHPLKVSITGAEVSVILLRIGGRLRRRIRKEFL
jgi:hypothetical protein